MSTPNPHKLIVVPDQDSKVTPRQAKALAKIERNKKRHKLGTYVDPEVRNPVLPIKDSHKLVEVNVPAGLWRRLWRAIRG